MGEYRVRYRRWVFGGPVFFGQEKTQENTRYSHSSLTSLYTHSVIDNKANILKTTQTTQKMTDSKSGIDTTRLMKAVHFAAIKHVDQRRKNADKHPYINHPIDVANLASEVGGITDVDILMGCILHDT
jgi:hypothetical protein